MSQVLRRNRKGSDSEIIRLNALGLSLSTIAGLLDCHPTSIQLRLQKLKIPTADTRRSFMEDVLAQLPANAKDVIADHLTIGADKPKSIKDYVRELIEQDLIRRQPTSTPESLTQG